MACSYCAARNSQVRFLSDGCIELSLRLGNRLFGIESRVEERTRQLQQLAITGNGIGEDLPFLVEPAHLKVVRGQLRLCAEQRRRHIGRARLRLIGISGDRVADGMQTSSV